MCICVSSSIESECKVAELSGAPLISSPPPHALKNAGLPPSHPATDGCCSNSIVLRDAAGSAYCPHLVTSGVHLPPRAGSEACLV